MRRGVVTRLAANGVTVHVAMAITGHTSVEAWKGYTQKQDEALKAAMRKTEEAHTTAMQAKSTQSEAAETPTDPARVN